MSRTIGFSDADGCKTIELRGIGSQAELHITRQPDGELCFAFISAENDQEDFSLHDGELADTALRYIGLKNLVEGEEP